MEQKRFYFDVGSNARGVYLRISEVGISCYVNSDLLTTWKSG